MHMNILNSNFKLKHGYETNSAVLQKLRYWSNLLRFGIGEDSTEVETGVGGGTLGVPWVLGTSSGDSGPYGL